MNNGFIFKSILPVYLLLIMFNYVHPGRVLRDLMKTEKNVMMVGAFNGLVGRILKSKGNFWICYEGFKAAYVSGAAVTASTGQPDIGLNAIGDFTKVISEIYMSSNLPIIADADTGFGNAIF